MNNEDWKYEGNNHPERDPQWQKDRQELFNRAGNGWWWGWTPANCPISDMKDYFIEKIKKEKELNKLASERETSMLEREKLISDKKWRESGRHKGEAVDCAFCGRPTMMRSRATRYCSKICGDRAYKRKTKWSGQQ